MRVSKTNTELLTHEYINSVELLQIICINAYLQILPELSEGITEKEIETKLGEFLKNKDIENYWYDIGIMVLIGENRFRDIPKKDYQLKSPSSTITLKKGNPVFIDFHPMDQNGIWGDFSSMFIFKPSDKDRNKVAFLQLIYDIHMQGIKQFRSEMTGAEVFHWYEGKYKESSVHLEDARNTVGHTMSQGAKKNADGSEKRIFLDSKNAKLIADPVLAIEPGGYKFSGNTMLVGRFEDCVYISKSGTAVILGRKAALPFLIS